MYLNKLLLKDFGKFNNYEIDLKSGINLLYGESDAGKSTIKDFAVGMMYGVDKSKGIGADDYDTRRPKDKRGYSGKAYIQSNNNKYFVERSFSRNGRSMSVMDVASGREVKTACKDSLHGTFIHMDKNAYVNTLCINEPNSYEPKELAEELNAYVGAITETGSPDINKHEILESLREERTKYDIRPILKKMDKLSEQIDEYSDVEEKLADVRLDIKKLDEEFAMEAAKKKREARTMVENEDGEVVYKENYRLNSKMDRLTKSEIYLGAAEDIEEPEEKLTDKIWFIILTGIFVVLVIAMMVNILGFEKGVKNLFVICTALFVIITIVEGLYEKGVFLDEISTPSDEEFQQIIAELEEKAGQAYESQDVDMTFATEYAANKTALKQKEKAIFERYEEKKKLEAEFASLKAMKESCDKERKAITMAIEIINSISDDISEEQIGLINGNTEDIVTRLTDGKCKDIKLDKKKYLEVLIGDKYVPIANCDKSLAKKIYFAVRLAIARAFCKNGMPIIIDDVIDTSDKDFLFNLIECLNTIDTEQLIILTSDADLGSMLTEINIGFNEVKIA